MTPFLWGALTGVCFASGVYAIGLFRRRLAETMIYRGDGLAAAVAFAGAAS